MSRIRQARVAVSVVIVLGVIGIWLYSKLTQMQVTWLYDVVAFLIILAAIRMAFGEGTLGKAIDALQEIRQTADSLSNAAPDEEEDDNS